MSNDKNKKGNNLESIDIIFEFDETNKATLKANAQGIDFDSVELWNILPPPCSTSIDFENIDPSKIQDYETLDDFTKMFLNNASDFSKLGDIQTLYSSKVDELASLIIDKLKQVKNLSNKKINLIFKANKDNYIQIENWIRPIVKSLNKKYQKLGLTTTFTDAFNFKFTSNKSAHEIDPATVLYYLSNFTTWQDFSKEQEKLLARVLSKASPEELDEMVKKHHRMFHEGQEMADLMKSKKHKK